MPIRKLYLVPLLVLGFVLSAKVVLALGFEVGESKADLKLDYSATMTDHRTGRVTFVLTITDEGRLKPLSGVDLVITDKTGSGRPELSVSLETSVENGKRIARVHLLKELAQRSQIMLKTNHLDGKQTPLTWYYHNIRLGEYLKK